MFVHYAAHQLRSLARLVSPTDTSGELDLTALSSAAELALLSLRMACCRTCNARASRAAGRWRRSQVRSAHPEHERAHACLRRAGQSSLVTHPSTPAAAPAPAPRPARRTTTIMGAMGLATARR